MRPYIDIRNKKFGKLIVIKYIGNSQWLCQCECGNKIIVKTNNLNRKYTTSCGCLKGNLKHKLSNTRLYNIWQNIKSRCYNKNHNYYYNYGGRGIKICDEWLNNFEVFYEWSIHNGYDDNLTIDRININGNYEPNNCRWTDRITQQNNTRKNKYINYNGRKLTVAEVARLLKKPYNTIYKRYRKEIF